MKQVVWYHHKIIRAAVLLILIVYLNPAGQTPRTKQKSRLTFQRIDDLPVTARAVDDVADSS
jgi:hypothetical protein